MLSKALFPSLKRERGILMEMIEVKLKQDPNDKKPNNKKNGAKQPKEKEFFALVPPELHVFGNLSLNL